MYVFIYSDEKQGENHGAVVPVVLRLPFALDQQHTIGNWHVCHAFTLGHTP
jgi:hypothetical protein